MRSLCQMGGASKQCDYHKSEAGRRHTGGQLRPNRRLGFRSGKRPGPFHVAVPHLPLCVFLFLPAQLKGGKNKTTLEVVKEH